MVNQTMTEYYKVAATLPAPGYQGSTQPNRGPKSIPSTQSKYPAPIDDAPPAYSDQESQPLMKPADVDPKLQRDCKQCERIMRRFLPLILLFFYTLLGGMAFHYIETKSESDLEVLKGHQQHIDSPAAIQLEKRMTEIVLDRNYTYDRRKYEVRAALLWYFQNLTVAENAKWDFTSALFFSMTLYTTIGYGDTPPHTSGGQIFTVIYSIIGIPLALIALIELGYLIAFAVSKLWTCVRRGWEAAHGKRTDFESLPDEKERQLEEDTDLLSFPLWALILLTFIWLLITAALFYYWESRKSGPHTNPWSYAESLYYAFISFTTIGLGDYVPASTSGKLGGIIFLLIGLSLLSTTFAVLQQKLEALQKSMQRSIDHEYQDAQGDIGEPMATDEEAVDHDLKRIASKMSPANRLLFFMMPEEKKRNLKQYYKNKAAMIPKSMQTDDYLWAMTSMSRSYLKQIAEETGAADPLYEDDSRSRDDVNSLVALCDLSLAPGGRQMDF